MKWGEGTFHHRSGLGLGSYPYTRRPVVSLNLSPESSVSSRLPGGPSPAPDPSPSRE